MVASSTVSGTGGLRTPLRVLSHFGNYQFVPNIRLSSSTYGYYSRIIAFSLKLLLYCYTIDVLDALSVLTIHLYCWVYFGAPKHSSNTIIKKTGYHGYSILLFRLLWVETFMFAKENTKKSPYLDLGTFQEYQLPFSWKYTKLPLTKS